MRFSLGFYNRIIFLFLISAIIFFAKNNIASAEFNDNLESYSIGQSADTIFDDAGGASVNWLISTGGTGTGTKKLFSDPNAINDSDIFGVAGDYTNSNVYCFDVSFNNFSYNTSPIFSWLLDNGSSYQAIWLLFKPSVVNNGFVQVSKAGTPNDPIFYLAQNYWHNICVIVDIPNEEFYVCNDIYSATCHDNVFPFYEVGDPATLDQVRIEHFTYSTGQNSDVSIDNFTTSEIPFDWIYDAEIIIEELPEWDGNIQVGSEFILSYNPYNFCFIGEDCLLKYNYGYDAIGGELSLLFEEEIIASTTLPDIRLLQGSFTLEDEPAGTEKEYCFLIETDTVRELYCDVSVEWIDRSWCKEELVCEDVATSSDFLYGVQCGFRRTICWMFNPTDNSIKYLSKNIQNFEHSFPFSLAFDFINVAEETIENSTSTGAVFGVPMVSTSTGDQFYIMPVMDENTIRDILSVKTVDTVTENVMYLVWAVTAGLIIFIVIKFGIL